MKHVLICILCFRFFFDRNWFGTTSPRFSDQSAKPAAAGVPSRGRRILLSSVHFAIRAAVFLLPSRAQSSTGTYISYTLYNLFSTLFFIYYLWRGSKIINGVKNLFKWSINNWRILSRSLKGSPFYHWSAIFQILKRIFQSNFSKRVLKRRFWPAFFSKNCLKHRNWVLIAFWE